MGLTKPSTFFVRVRRETGKKSVVRVHYGEGVAIQRRNAGRVPLAARRIIEIMVLT
jgi:hypothetical protein